MLVAPKVGVLRPIISEHSAKILDYARERGRPIAAIVNTHWHLDHTTGNCDIRQAYPAGAGARERRARRRARDLPRRQAADQTEAMLADPKTNAMQRDQILRARCGDGPTGPLIRPSRVVGQSGTMTIAGRQIDVRLAKFAASEGDVWLYDPEAKLAIVGDLVVDIVPFMDTACAGRLAPRARRDRADPFATLIPGHGRDGPRGLHAWRRHSRTSSPAAARSAEEDCVAVGSVAPPLHRRRAPQLRSARPPIII